MAQRQRQAVNDPKPVECTLEFDPGIEALPSTFRAYAFTLETSVRHFAEAFDLAQPHIYYKMGGQYFDVIDFEDEAGEHPFRIVFVLNFNRTTLQAKRIAKAMDCLRLYHGAGSRSLKLSIDGQSISINNYL